jgi:hypothetical protein
VVGRAAFALERDFLAAIGLFLVRGCSDRFASVTASFAVSLTRRTRRAKIDTSFEKVAVDDRYVALLGTRHCRIGFVAVAGAGLALFSSTMIS